MKLHIVLIVWIFCFLNVSAQKFDKLAKTPPMGWNSWNKYGCNVSEKLIMQMADAMVSSGMQEAGYEYIIIDDCWQVSRDSMGFIVPDPERFPSGIKALADYIHSRGLKFGIYSCAGTKTCAGRLGSHGHEFQDAYLYAKWGVDYLKYDWCNTSTQDKKSSYSIMRDALYSTGRPIVFSICEWGATKPLEWGKKPIEREAIKPWDWGKEIGHLWRTTQDIVDRWDIMIDILDQQKGLEKYAGPGHWNDPDMLEVGNEGMTTDEYKTHFSMWCMLAAPLIAGNDLGNMSPETKEILTNAEIIALDQDTLGKQGFCYRDNGDYEIWIKNLINNEKAACLLNQSDEVKEVLVDFNMLIKASNNYWTPDSYQLSDYRIRDLWEHKELILDKNPMYIKIPPHTVKLYRFIKK